MKPFVFSRDSWHYWLAKDVGNFRSYRTESNICEYTRAVLKGAMIVIAVAASALAMLYWITITLVWWVVVLQHGFFEATGPIVLSLVVGIFGSAILIMEGLPWLFKKARRKLYDARGGSHRAVKTDTFITKAYRSWKDKTCVKVTLIGDTSDE